MNANVAAPVLAPPDMAAVSAAVCLSLAAPTCSASPPAVPYNDTVYLRCQCLYTHRVARHHYCEESLVQPAPEGVLILIMTISVMARLWWNTVSDAGRQHP